MRDFLAQIAAAPDDPAPYLIFADALKMAGDPRGDLITYQHALETADVGTATELRRLEAALIDANEQAWLGSLLPHRDALAVRWRFGFLHAARLADDVDAARPALAALLATPGASSTLAELRLGSPWAADDDDEWSACQRLLDDLEAAWPAGLRRLHVCDADLRGLHLAPPVRIPERAKTLDTLVVQSPSIELAWDASPALLRRLELRSPRLADRALLAVREWPNLESLVVWTEDPSRILWLLARAKLPRLRHLGLCGTSNTPELVAELMPHLAVNRFESLDLRGGVLTMTKMLQLIANRVKLDVRHNLIGKEERKQLRAFGAQVTPQRRGSLPLTHRGALWREHARVTGKDYSDQRKSFAATPDPSWLFEDRYNVADDFEPREQLAILEELATDCRAELLQAGSADRADIYLAIANVCENLGEHQRAEGYLWLAVGDARWYELPDIEIRALGHIGTIRMRRGDPATAVPIMDQVLAYHLDQGSPGERAWALRQRGNVDLVRSEYATAEGFYRRALDIYREQKDRNNEGIVLSELSGVLWSRQDFEGAVAMLEQSIALRPADSLGLGSCHYNLGAVLNGMGRIEEAIEAARTGLAIFRKHERADGIGQCLSLLGELMQRSNRLDEAERMLDEALALQRQRGALRETGITLGNLSLVALDRGRYAAARACCEEAVELHREVGNKYNEGMQLIGLVDAAIGERRFDDALALVDEALVPLVAIANLPAIAAAKLRRGYVAQLRGDHALAERHYDDADADATRGNYRELVGWSTLWRGDPRDRARARRGRRAARPGALARRAQRAGAPRGRDDRGRDRAPRRRAGDAPRADELGRAHDRDVRSVGALERVVDGRRPRPEVQRRAGERELELDLVGGREQHVTVADRSR